MTKYKKIFKALSDTFDITPLNEEIDDFETTLNEYGFEIVQTKIDNIAKEKLPPRWRVKCRVCGADEPKELDYDSISFGWIMAVPEGVFGIDAVKQSQYWCSEECRNRDPRLNKDEAELEVLNRIAGAK